MRRTVEETIRFYREDGAYVLVHEGTLDGGSNLHYIVGLVEREMRLTLKSLGYFGHGTYGAGDAKFSTTAGVSFETGSAFMAKLKQRYPGMEIFSRQVEKVANERFRSEGRPYVISPLTRQPYYLKRDDKVYALLNYLVQGSAASVQIGRAS